MLALYARGMGSFVTLLCAIRTSRVLEYPHLKELQVSRDVSRTPKWGPKVEAGFPNGASLSSLGRMEALGNHWLNEGIDGAIGP